MSLQACRECSREVAHDAKRCPGCGAVSPTYPGWLAVLLAPSTLGAVLFFGFCLLIIVMWVAERAG